MKKKVRKSVLLLALFMALFLPSFSFDSQAAVGYYDDVFPVDQSWVNSHKSQIINPSGSYADLSWWFDYFLSSNVHYPTSAGYTGMAYEVTNFQGNTEYYYYQFMTFDSWHVSFNGANGFSMDYNTFNGSFAGMLSTIISNLNDSLKSLGEAFIYHTNYHLYSNYDYWSLNIDSTGEFFSKVVTNRSGTWNDVILNRLNYIGDVLTFTFSRLYEWFYPLDNVDPEYWRYYNTDTKASENIGLAGLMYNITWYLGQLYVLQSANQALDNMGDAVENVTTTFESIEAQEEAVISSVSSHIEAFNPSTSDFGALRALPWMSQYLQSIYTSLGAYGTVITIGLLLGVCLQIIGYARYK